MSDPSERVQRGLETMREVYDLEFEAGPGDFFELTAGHLFGDVWRRPGLDVAQRRLLLIGLLAGRGREDVVRIQLGAALRRGELDPDALREIVVFLAHYAGWPTAAALNTVVEEVAAEHGDDGPDGDGGGG